MCQFVIYANFDKNSPVGLLNFDVYKRPLARDKDDPQLLIEGLREAENGKTVIFSLRVLSGAS